MISAAYVNDDGSANCGPEFHLGHGILTRFDSVVVPQEGGALLAISSGTARNPDHPDYFTVEGYPKGYQTGPAPGFPVESPSCPNTVFTGDAYDSIALRLQIKTPTNAKSLSFNIDFYTTEYPIFICSTYNDFVTAILSPTPVGLQNGNISFDSLGNPLSVNAGFLEVCACQTGSPPCNVNGKQFSCALGTDQLQGTGFEAGAATGWLQTAAPIAEPGEAITLDLGVWDAGDGFLDTTGLVDNFRFHAEETPTVTEPVEQPK